MLICIYQRPEDERLPFEHCFYIAVTRELTSPEMETLTWLFAEPFMQISATTRFEAETVTEVGPRLSFETPFSSRVVAICRTLGLPIVRVEKSTRWLETENSLTEYDRMTQMVYAEPLTSFDSGLAPAAVERIPVLDFGHEALQKANERLGLGMDERDIDSYTKLFTELGRDPTDVELFQIGNGMSEHSRHWFFRGVQKIDGVTMPHSLMDIVKAPWRAHPNNNLVAFHDNAGVIRGTKVPVFLPAFPGETSSFSIRELIQHITATAETHNHPTMIAPFPGAETGAGGRIRDSRAVGRGGLAHAGFAGYCYGDIGRPQGKRHASPLEVILSGHAGIADYGNKIGEPLICGFCRSFAGVVNGEHREFIKPVLYTAGLGRVFDLHVTKRAPEAGMHIVRFGGPAYRIGLGGGAASSMAAGANSADLDLKSVQRGDAQMENSVNRVIQACAELLEHNPIESIHDQGAGGPSNVITELVEPAGGRVDIREIVLGDRTMSILEIWSAEYQEGYGALIRPENLKVFKKICERERVNCEVLGEVTGDGAITVYDGATGEIVVDLPLAAISAEVAPKTFVSEHLPVSLSPLELPHDLSIATALRLVFSLHTVGSKRSLVNVADRSVGGLVARQQCCGPMQIPVADYGMTADGYFGLSGAAAALGENPNRMLINPSAGARMAVAEMLTNLAGAGVTKLRDIACRANWMWSAKRSGQGALLYDAAVAMRDIMRELEITVNGGKDSLSMEALAEVNGVETRVMSPGELVIFGYAPVSDITKGVTPNLRGSGDLWLLDPSRGRTRLGGSALAQGFGQLGNDCPDIEDPELLARAFTVVTELIDKGLVTAYHDRSDGGLITTIAEMAMAGNCGVTFSIPPGASPLEYLFAEEVGMVIETPVERRREVQELFDGSIVPAIRLGRTCKEREDFTITQEGRMLFSRLVVTLRKFWEEVSTELEMESGNPDTVAEEVESFALGRGVEYKLTFTPSAPALMSGKSRPYVAILREEGTNGDREMAAAFKTAGCEPVDLTMSDLRRGALKSLERFQGLVFPGGFSYADVLGSARGWAASMREHAGVREMVDAFYKRADTFSLGVCNGCQLMSYFGVVPWTMSEESLPKLLHNASGRFESRWSSVKILPSPSIFTRGMEDSVLGVWVAHGEGRFYFPEPYVAEHIEKESLAPIAYVDPDGRPTEEYPYNPNGSPKGYAGLCSRDGRHFMLMPHPERSFLSWQWPWMSDDLKNLPTAPWLQGFVNLREWCLAHK